MNKQTCIFIGGYARAGKTSVLRELETRGYAVESTSKTLYYYLIGALLGNRITSFDQLDLAKTLREGGSLCEISPDLLRRFQDKSRSIESMVKHDTGVSIREAMIWLAEKVIVPTLGRENGIIYPTVERLRLKETGIALFETIGGGEFNITERLLYSQFDHRRVNMRSETEQKGTDSRQLLPDSSDVWFDANQWYGADNLAYRDDIVQQILGACNAESEPA
jgi:hypothetical protein